MDLKLNAPKSELYKYETFSNHKSNWDIFQILSQPHFKS